MIYTVTLNPSVDYIVGVENFDFGHLNVASFEAKSPGGKGINVSQVLKKLGHDSTALGFIGGFTGAYIQHELTDSGIKSNFIEVDGDTRINIKLKTERETEINGVGPEITAKDKEKLFDLMGQMEREDVMVIAGSLPKGVGDDIYKKMLKSANAKGIRVILDAKGKALKKAISERPFLIKPNHHELGELFDTEITSVEEAVRYGRQLLGMGPRHVIVSMGGEGAVYLDEGQALFANVPEGTLKNSVGAGDSVVAGFTASFLEDDNLEKAFRYGVATGSATAFSLGFATLEKVEELLDQIHIKKL